jgi:putative endopeptidase
MKHASRLLLAAACVAAISCSHGAEEAPNPTHFLAADRDTTVSPGTDFFHYANGTWLEEHPIPASERGWGVWNLVQDQIYDDLKTVCEEAAGTDAAAGSKEQKIGDFWHTGMDTVAIDRQGIEPLREDLDRIDAISDRKGLLAEIALQQTYEAFPLFQPWVDQDEKQSDRYAFHLYQGGIGLPNRDYYTKTDERTENIRKEYVKHVAAMFELLDEDPAAADAHSQAVMSLETRLARASRKLEDLRDPYANYHKMSVAELDNLAPSLGWSTLLPAMSIEGVDSVIVGQPEFYKEVEKTLNDVPLEVWKAYLRWTLVNHFASSLSSPFEKEDFHFYQTVLSGVKEPRPRWKRVLRAEEGAMGDLLGRLFVERYVPASMKARYTKLVDDVFAAYAQRIKKLDWMSEATKQQALAKLGSITKKVCYPDKWKDYSALTIDRSSYCANRKRADVWDYMYHADKLGKPVDRTEWQMTPQTYNAYYNPSNNEIVLPAAIFFIPGVADSLVDDAIIYGYAGASTIGHEVTHGFDDEGRQFDARGNLRDWWTKKDEIRFNQRAKRMVEQFDAYTVLDSLHVNGKATLGENIADLGGVLNGYDAFKRTAEGQADTLIDGLTPDQRFFLAYAYSWMGQIRDETLARQVMTDVHSPNFLRVNGPLSDVPAFYKAFGVKPGDPMYRPDSLRVKIW